jgi:hypothetical protein
MYVNAAMKIIRNSTAKAQDWNTPALRIPGAQGPWFSAQERRGVSSF